jgi:hypothetical protein
MSAEDVVAVLNAVSPRLVDGAVREVAQAWPDLLAVSPALLFGIVEARLSQPENAKYLKPVHPPGSVEALAATLQSRAPGFQRRDVQRQTPVTPPPAPAPTAQTVKLNQALDLSNPLTKHLAGRVAFQGSGGRLLGRK